MASSPESTIDKVGWHTGTPGNTESREAIHRRFRAIIKFLQDNRLTVRQIASPDPAAALTDETAIRTVDLTEDGLRLVKRCYDKWLRRIDNGMSPDDMSILERELQKLRGD